MTLILMILIILLKKSKIYKKIFDKYLFTKYYINVLILSIFIKIFTMFFLI